MGVQTANKTGSNKSIRSVLRGAAEDLGLVAAGKERMDKLKEKAQKAGHDNGYIAAFDLLTLDHIGLSIEEEQAMFLEKDLKRLKIDKELKQQLLDEIRKTSYETFERCMQPLPSSLEK